MLKHVDLFSGLGGFAYGLQELCGGFETVAFCEIDKACHPILEKNFPGVPIYDDVRSFPCDRYAGADIITGGFPCQPASVAGKQKGRDDDRWLWPELVRVVGEIRPKWAIFENVTGLLALEAGMVFESCMADMEMLDYNVQPFVIPACAKGAQHRRDRVWIIAHASRTRLERRHG